MAKEKARVITMSPHSSIGRASACGAEGLQVRALLGTLTTKKEDIKLSLR